MEKNLSLLKYIESNTRTLSIDEIKSQLSELLRGLKIRPPRIATGSFFYRARKICGQFNKTSPVCVRDLSYPPKASAKMGRLNRDGQPLFYSSVGKEPLLFEIPDLRPGDEIVLSIWQTNAPLWLNTIGYSQEAFKRLGSFRSHLQWWNNPDGSGKGEVRVVPSEKPFDLPYDENTKLTAALSDCFTCVVGEENYHKYKLTAAIAEIYLSDVSHLAIRFGGVMYPSIRLFANGDNVALMPWFVDAHLEFRKALHIRIEEIDATKFAITTVDSALTVTSERELIWLGRLPKWTIEVGREAECIATAGRDSWGDYEYSSDGSPVYWAVTDTRTGLPILPA